MKLFNKNVMGNITIDKKVLANMIGLSHVSRMMEKRNNPPVAEFRGAADAKKPSDDVPALALLTNKHVHLMNHNIILPLPFLPQELSNRRPPTSSIYSCRFGDSILCSSEPSHFLSVIETGLPR